MMAVVNTVTEAAPLLALVSCSAHSGLWPLSAPEYFYPWPAQPDPGQCTSRGRKLGKGERGERGERFPRVMRGEGGREGGGGGEILLNIAPTLRMVTC